MSELSVIQIENRPCLKVENVWEAVIRTIGIFHSIEKGTHGIHPSAVVDPSSQIGANTCIDRAFLDETRIGEGSKIDNLVQVGHNCRI